MSVRGCLRIHSPRQARVTIEAPDPRLPPEVETALYRIVQEALSNAVRHGAARAISVQIRDESAALRAVIRDDGLTLVGRGVPEAAREVEPLHGRIGRGSPR